MRHSVIETTPRRADVAAAVREAVEAKGTTVADLVTATGIARATLYRKLDSHGDFDVEELAKIAAATDTTVGAIIARAEQLAAA